MIKKVKSKKIAIVAILLLLVTIRSQPCVESTEDYGRPVTDADKETKEIVVTDDDMTRMTKLKYCVCKKNSKTPSTAPKPWYEHFRGFEVEIYSPTSGYKSQAFGNLDDDPNICEPTMCKTYDFGTEELMWLTLYSDGNDIEGMVWEGHLGTEWIARANGNDSGPKNRMKGRPIGFKVVNGVGGLGEKANQPLHM